MMHPAEQPEVDDVLQHLDWVQALALRLLGDPAEADDVRQDVWLLTRRVRVPGEGLRAWLGGVVRNVVRERRRARAIRDRHEEGAAVQRSRAAEDEALVREVLLQQLVVQRLMALPEHYRSALLGRYYEHLGPEELARRTGLPVATIKTRLRRGLELLRGSVERDEYEGRPAILALGAALGRPVRPLGDGAAFSAAGTSTTFIAAAVVAGLCVVTGIVWSTRQVQPKVDVDGLLVGAESESAESNEAALDANRVGEAAREELAAIQTNEPAEATARELESEAAAVAELSVRVIDVFGRAVPNHTVRLGTSSGEARAATDSDGACSFPHPGAALELSADGPGYITVAQPRSDLELGTQAVLVVAERLRLFGRVLTAEGEPIPRALVVCGLAAQYQSRLRVPLAELQFGSYQVLTDARGTYAIDVPWDGAALELRVERVGFRVAHATFTELDLDLDAAGAPRGARAIPIELEPLTDPSAAFGRVLAADGRPVADAWVSDGKVFVGTNEMGEFQLGTLGDGEPSGWLTAVAHGRAAASVQRTPSGAPYTLVLRGPSLALSGTVRDRAGAPAAGVIVQVLDPTPFGRAEFVYLGREAQAELSLEALADSRGTPLSRPSGAVTDSVGRFVLDGLGARTYELEVFDPATLARVSGRAWQAGTGGIELLAPERPRPLAGRVTDLAGAPLSGVRIDAYEQPDRARGEGLMRPHAITADDGSFRFEALAREGVALLPELRAGWLAPNGGSALSGREDDVQLTICPAVEVRLILDLGANGLDRQKAATLHFEDRNGAELTYVAGDVVEVLQNRTTLPTPRADGRVYPLSMWVPTTAEQLVVTQSGATTLRIPLSLRRGAGVSLEL